jgi:hypothetical protein
VGNTHPTFASLFFFQQTCPCCHALLYISIFSFCVDLLTKASQTMVVYLVLLHASLGARTGARIQGGLVRFVVAVLGRGFGDRDDTK